MLVGNTSEDEDNTRSLQREETYEISSLLNEFPANTNILIVDTNLTTLLNMKSKIMRQYTYQVTIEPDAERALAFLTSCKHEINIVIWDFHMPGINGLQALEIIGSKMDLPVVIMSDDNQTESVMKATIHGACDYVMKPVKEEVIANIWQHIVRKRMNSKPDIIPPVQSDVAQSDGLGQDNVGYIINQEQNIDKNEETAAQRTWITWTGDTNLVPSNLVQTDDLDYFKSGEQNIDKEEEKAAKKPRMTWTEETQLVHQSDLVQMTDGLDQENDNDDFNMINQDNDEQNIEKRVGKKARKPRMTWTRDLHQKFLEAIDIVGGIEKANPKLVLERLREMKVEGLTRNNVASHLQKHRINLEETQIPQQTQEIGWSNVFRPAPSLQGLDNVHTAVSPYLTNGRALNPIQQNQYRNGYLTMNNNQFITNPQPRLPYFDHHLHQHQQQQYQPSHQFNYMMSMKEPEQTSGIYATDLEPTYPSLPYDPNEFLIDGYNFNQ